MEIQFTVHGVAQPAGSKRAFALRRRDGSFVTRPGGSPVINVTDDNPKSKSWKQEVAAAAAQAMGDQPLMQGPLHLVVCFVMPRPKHHYRANGELKPNAPKYHTSKPDVTKLMRGLEDAMTSVVWKDDAQVARQYPEKVYGEKAKVLVGVRTIDEATVKVVGGLPRHEAAPLFDGA